MKPKCNECRSVHGPENTNTLCPLSSNYDQVLHERLSSQMLPWDEEDQFLANGDFQAAVNWQKKAEEYRLNWENACEVGRRLEVRLDQVLTEKHELEEAYELTDHERVVLDALSEIQTPALKTMHAIDLFPALVKVVEAELERRGVK